MELLLRAGAPVNVMEYVNTPRLFKVWSKSGRGTPLHVAVQDSDAEMVKILLDHGGD